MYLICTLRSHFSRKVRVLLDALSLDIELTDIGNVADANAEGFSPNPLMKVPTLIDGDNVVFDSDYIAQYIVHKYDSGDQFNVLTNDIPSVNARVVMNGVMAAEVELLLAARTGIDTSAYVRFDKSREVIKNGLNWLESHIQIFQGPPSYLGFHLVCMWDHLIFCDFLPSEDYTQLRDCVECLSALEFIALSTPK